MNNCSTEECERDALWRGLCRGHYEQWRRARPGVREREAAYDRRRRKTTERQVAERQRNNQRREYLNRWARKAGVGHRHRARYYGGDYESFDPIEVFRRDGWRCQLCGCLTEGEWPAPTSPTLDHVVPLARGGDHTLTNVQCACFRCNCSKGAGGRVAA